MVRTLFLLTVLSLMTSAAFAAPPPEGGSSNGDPVVLHSDREAHAQALMEQFAPDEDSCPNYASSATMVLPVTLDDQLYAYAFVTPRLCLARGVSEFAITSQMHFIIDAMVRAAHATPMTLDGDLLVQREATLDAMLTAARGVVGETQIEQLQLLGSDVRALR